MLGSGTGGGQSTADDSGQPDAGTRVLAKIAGKVEVGSCYRKSRHSCWSLQPQMGAFLALLLLLLAVCGAQQDEQV